MTVRRAIILLLIAFLVFFVIQSPVEAATIVRNTARTLSDVFVSAAKSFSTFLRTLF